MTKSKVSFVLLACLCVAMVALMAVPMGAGAAIGTVKWATPVFEGVDSYYGVGTIVAYEAGATAQVSVPVNNDQGVDVTIREATITMDWGAVHAATVAPTVLRTGETGTFTFDVPIPATASNTMLHNYKVNVGFQKQDTDYVKNLAVTDAGVLVVGNTYQFDHPNIVSDTVKVYFVNTLVTPWTIVQQTTGWMMDTQLARLGQITFGSPVPAGTAVYADYRYCETATGTVDGVNKVFYTQQKPVVSGTLRVFFRSDFTNDLVEATGFTADLETGKITLATAPTTFQTVWVSYEYWTRWGTVSMTDLAVYSADQAAAVVAKKTYSDMNSNYPQYLFTPGTAAARARAEANVSAAKAATEYSVGDFANAKTDYEAAVASLQAAIEADNTLNTGTETALIGLLSGADGVIDAYSAKLNGEAKESNGQASMYKNVGVFTILLGVATLLAGIAGIFWAFSRYVEAKGPRQQT